MQSIPLPLLLLKVNGTPATARFQARVPQRWQDFLTSIFSATWLPDRLSFLGVALLSGSLLPPSHHLSGKAFSEYDSHLKMNYLLEKLISVSQQEPRVPTGFESAVVWLMDECFRGSEPTLELQQSLASHLL